MGMEAAGPLLGRAPRCHPNPPPTPALAPCRPYLLQPSLACCCLPTEAEGLVQDPGPTLWLPAAARLLQCHSLEVAAGGGVVPLPGGLLPPAGGAAIFGHGCSAR